MSNQVENHQPTEYVFELIVGGKSAKSGILKVKEKIIRLRLIGMFFDTNKNFLLPDAMKGIRELVHIYEENPDSELLVVGHTDRSGSPSYNDPLSVERADAVAAFLTDDVDAWLARYKSSVSSKKRWGKVEDLHMLESLADFSTKPKTQSAVEWFQETRGLPDNIAETRRQLITEYMAHDRTTLPAGIKMVTHGCGENFPLDEAGNIDTNALDGESDAQDRRVEIFVFDKPGIRPKPKGKNSKKGSKEYPKWREITSRTYDFRTDHEKILHVHLSLVWKDPAGIDHPFPEHMDAIVSFGDGSDDLKVKVEENGLLDFTIEKSKQSFTLGFEHSEASYFVTMPELTSEELVTRSDVAALIKDGAHAFLLPQSWNLDNCDWEVDTTKATTYVTPNFTNLSSIEKIGEHTSPCRVELKLNWQYMKFLYFDRKLKTKLSVLPLMVEGFNNSDASSGDPDTQSNWITKGEACQCLPWIRTKGDDGSTISKDKRLLQFRTNENTFIYSLAASASGGGRKLVTKNATSVGNDPGLNQGENSTIELKHEFNIADGTNGKRLALYDLPSTWKSRAYFTKYKNESGQFEKFAAETTSDTNPFLFSLDDIVLTDDNLEPISWIPDEQIINRVAIFSHTFSGGSNLSNIGLYKEDSGNNQGYFTQRPSIETDRNYIADYPDWTRLVITQGNLFDVFDKRVAAEPDGVVGARAGVRWIDATKSPNFTQHKGPHPTGEMSNRPKRTEQDFFSIQPMYEQRHPGLLKKLSKDSLYNYYRVGRYDMVLLRCCDLDADGVTEISCCILYFRFFFNFKPTFEENTKPKVKPLGLVGEDAKKWYNTAITNLLRRWNGPDSSNSGPAQIVPKDSSKKFRANTMWFAQSLPSNVAHYELGVFKKIRAYMSSKYGQGALEKGDNTPVPKTLGYTFAHEVGHAASLQDEYIEPTRYKNVTGKVLPNSLPSFDCNSPGDPYQIDDKSMMNGSTIVDARNYWHIAEWLRELPSMNISSNSKGSAQYIGSTFDIKYGTYKYNIPNHFGAPAQGHISWPLDKKIDYTVGKFGEFNVFFYPLGEERFSAKVLPLKVKKPLGPRFDGIIVILVKLHFDFHIMFNLLTQNSIHKFLVNIDQQIKLRFNNKFFVQGTFEGQNYSRVLLNFSPRYWVENPGKDYSKEEPLDRRNHMLIEMKAGGTPKWHPPSFANSRYTLRFPFKQHKGHVFARFFAEIFGLSEKTMKTASAFEPIIQGVLPGGTVHDI